MKKLILIPLRDWLNKLIHTKEHNQKLAENILSERRRLIKHTLGKPLPLKDLVEIGMFNDILGPGAKNIALYRSGLVFLYTNGTLLRLINPLSVFNGLEGGVQAEVINREVDYRYIISTIERYLREKV